MSQVLPTHSLTVLAAGGSSMEAQLVLPKARTGFVWLPTPETFTQAASQILGELERKGQWDKSKPRDVKGTTGPCGPSTPEHPGA